MPCCSARRSTVTAQPSQFELYPRKHREMLRAIAVVKLGIGARKVSLRALDSAYSIAFPKSTPLNVSKQKR